MKDYKKDFNDKLEDESFCDGELISIANGYITEMQNIITELEKENAELKEKLNRYKHDCPNCSAFGKHCPHRVNGDPYTYDCYLTVADLEKENAEQKDEVRKLKLLVSSLVYEINQIWDINEMNEDLRRCVEKIDREVQLSKIAEDDRMVYAWKEIVLPKEIE